MNLNKQTILRFSRSLVVNKVVKTNVRYVSNINTWDKRPEGSWQKARVKKMIKMDGKASFMSQTLSNSVPLTPKQLLNLVQIEKIDEKYSR